MAQEFESVNPNQEGWLGSCLLWFFWGISLSFLTILSLVLMVMLTASVALNVYLGWQLAGLQVAVSRRAPQPIEAVVPVPPNVLAAIPTHTAELMPTSTPTPTPIPTEALFESQLATVAAIATQVAAAQLANPPVGTQPAVATPAGLPPTVLPPAIAIDTPAADLNPAQSIPANPVESASSSGSTSAVVPAATSAATPVAAASLAQEFVPPASSSNQYALIPINGQRESRPPAEHGDLNLELREPVPSNVEAALVEIPGSGIDPNAPKFSSVFSPDQIAGTYAVHDWDWATNSPGNLLPENEAVLLALKTTPGEPLFIPKTESDIYDGKYYATLLYASEDSLTFVYAREGTVAMGYTVHYEGLNTDPNLLKLFEESKGNELPGLTLDTPVGWASDELLIAIRDNGKFLDTRSKKDWWE